VVVVTRGPDGAVALTADGREVTVPGERVEVVDTVGAGDAFTSGLLAWLDREGVTDRAALSALDDGGARGGADLRPPGRGHHLHPGRLRPAAGRRGRRLTADAHSPRSTSSRSAPGSSSA
jgi:hypothetical protein